MANTSELPALVGRPGLVPNESTPSGYDIVDLAAVQVRSRRRTLSEVARDALAALKPKRTTLPLSLDGPWA